MPAPTPRFKRPRRNARASSHVHTPQRRIAKQYEDHHIHEPSATMGCYVPPSFLPRARKKKNRQLSWKHDDNATVRFVTISEPAWKRGSEASASSRRTNPFRSIPPVTIHPSRLSAIASRCSFYFSKHPQSRNLKKQQQQTRNQVKTAAKTSRDLEHDLFVVYTVLSRFLSRFLFFFFDFLWQTGTVGRRGNELKSERV